MGRGNSRRRASIVLVVLVGALAAGCERLRRKRDRDPDQLRSVHERLDSQHRTQLEPDSFGYGDTVVATFQTGRFFDGGSSNIGWATTTNAGRTWTTGMLPGTTVYEGGPWTRISDPAVAYDPLHDVWMISTLAIDANVSGAAILTSRSTDGGLTWGQPGHDVDLERDVLRQELDHLRHVAAEPALRQLLPGVGRLRRFYMSTSTDGGLTWGPKKTPGSERHRRTAGRAAERHRRRPVRGRRRDPRVPLDRRRQHVAALGRGRDRQRARRRRTAPHLAAAVGGGGRRRQGLRRVAGLRASARGCSSNDIVYSTSMDGVAWTAKVAGSDRPDRTAASTTSSRASRSTARPRATSTRLALGYYYYPVAQLHLGHVPAHGRLHVVDRRRRDVDAGTKVAGPISLSWIASTNQGVMVGDYMSTSFAGGTFAFPIFAVAKPKTGTTFDERAYSARFDVTLPSDRAKVPHAPRPDPRPRTPAGRASVEHLPIPH